ncbi:MAG TPA: CcoQ/FixQ family Cbb3-type cytochrome c oxidase assembly chaperone [Nitrospira sp.]|nr:CcoQ/FixQ family Cbb3-type cytochrome c oxidase assembly chaperone [Nitrospira sp.]
MDINDLRSIFTVLTFLVFVGIVWWAYSGHRRQAFEEAASLPLDDDTPFIPDGPSGKDK